MAGAVRKVMEYLSFAEPEDELYDEEPVEARDRERANTADSVRPAAREVPAPAVAEAADRTERMDMRNTDEGSQERAARTERIEPVGDRRAQVTPIKANLGHELNRIVTVHPTSYSEARSIGEAFREGIPVIMNLTDLGEPDAKRMVDFAAGLVFGLFGTIERVTNRVFLLSPATVDVETEGQPSDGHAGRFYQQH